MLEEFFQPKTIAVIGASREPHKVGHQIFKNLVQSGGFNHLYKVYPVNPKTSEILGSKTYPSIKEIAEKIDLAVIVVPAEFVGQTLIECGEIGDPAKAVGGEHLKGTKAVIIISAGFKEIGGEGYKREQQILEIARKYGIRILGPNCLGLLNPHHYLNASFVSFLPERGEIAFISQSGALCSAVLDWAKAEEIGFSKFVSLGNKADLNEIDFLLALANDEQTKVIIAYLEGIEKGQEFIRVAKEVTKKKPVIVLKPGKTAGGKKAISSHTGTLAGLEQAYEAAFKQAGIIRAYSVEELLDYALVFAYSPRFGEAGQPSTALAGSPIPRTDMVRGLPTGNRVAVITNAGGPGIMATDEVESLGLQLAFFQEETIEFLKNNLPSQANIYNPVDVLGDAPAKRYELALKALLIDENVDIIVVLLTPQAVSEVKETGEVIVKLAKEVITSESTKPILACFMGEAEVKETRRFLNQNKIPNYAYPERAIACVKALVEYKNWRERKIEIKIEMSETPPRRWNVPSSREKKKAEEIIGKVKSERRLNLVDLEVKEVLSAYGFKFPHTGLAKTAEEAVSLAEEIGYPVALKISSPEILHKTDFGGVRLNLMNRESVRDAFEAMVLRSRRFFPEAEIYGCLVQEMTGKGIEVILGLHRDVQFGPLVMFGLGGIYVEILKDISFRVAPFSLEEAKEMMKEIKGYPLLQGIRGEKGIDLDLLASLIMNLSQLALDFTEIMELDINPLVVYPSDKSSARKEPVVVDAKIVIK